MDSFRYQGQGVLKKDIFDLKAQAFLPFSLEEKNAIL